MFGTRFVGQSSDSHRSQGCKPLTLSTITALSSPVKFGWKCRSRTYKQMVQSHRALPVCVTSNAITQGKPHTYHPHPCRRGSLLAYCDCFGVTTLDRTATFRASTGRTHRVYDSDIVARLAGFEPTLPDSESGVLPLDDGRMFGDLYGDRTRLYTVDSRAPHQSAYRPRE